MNPIQAIKLLSAWHKLKEAWENRGPDMGLTFSQVLKSKTVWTVAATGAVNIWEAVQSDPSIKLSPQTMTIINAAGTLLGILFRSMNSQKPAPKP